MKKRSRLSLVLLAAMVITLCVPVRAEAATVRLNKKALTLEIGGTARLRMQGTDRKVNWSSKDESVATVTTAGKVTAEEAGTTTIYAAVGSKRYACKVTVLPEFQINEEELAEELDGRMFEINGQSFQVQADEIGEVEILSQTRSKDNRYLQIRAEIEIDRTIALLHSEVKLWYKNSKTSWKLYKVTTNTAVEEWNLEGIWKGGTDVLDYSRNYSEYRDLILDIYDVKDDGFFGCEATLAGEYTDVVDMAGEFDPETGELQIIGLDWIDASSPLAQDLSRRGKVYCFYAVPDFAEDAFVTDTSISTRETFVSDMLVEKELAEEEEEKTEEWLSEDEMEETEEEMIYEE